MDSNRDASADRFLNLIRHSRRGRFKIYIGMAAGVGKSYRMLQEAHQILGKGVDVEIGLIVTHERKETVALLEGLPVIPQKKVFYKGKELEELDLDAILKRHPQVVIVDELAHTNVPGSKNEKRWQDVMEILDAGINVIAAMNIQHIESLNNVVEKITGQEVKERVPDSVMAQADEVVNIDLPVDELHQRLQEGKIYAAEKVQTALQNFFQRENLMQLRELALREVANTIENKIDREFTVTEHKSNDRLLCCISTNEKGAKKAIRKTARLADRFDAEWFALYVQTSREAPESVNIAAQRHLINNFQMATELGGSIIKEKSDYVVEGILKTIQEKNITIVIMGKSKVSFFKRAMELDVMSRLLNRLEGTGTDLLIVN